MSRNLCRRDCAVCEGHVTLSEAPRKGTAKDFGVYNDQYEGMMVANAECLACGTPYLAWVDERTRTSLLYHESDRWAAACDDEPFIDLSYRNSFNDEPASDGSDNPTHEVICIRVPSSHFNQWRPIAGGVCAHGHETCAKCRVHRGRVLPIVLFY